MTTQSTGSLKGRLAGVFITLVALPILVLAPAFLADRYATQSPGTDGQTSIQPSTAGVSDEHFQGSNGTADETLTQLEEGFSVIIESDEDFAREYFSGEVVILDTQPEDDCVLMLRFVDSTNGASETITGTIRFQGEEIGSSIGECGIYLADW